MKRVVALGVVAAWILLLSIRVADAYEDAQAGLEPVDAQVAQALTTPAVPLTALSLALPRPPAPHAFDQTLADPTDASRFTLLPPSPMAAPPGPPPRARPRLFHAFSIYRL